MNERKLSNTAKFKILVMLVSIAAASFAGGVFVATAFIAGEVTR